MLWNQLELLYSLHKEIGAEPPGPSFRKIYIIHPIKKNLNQSDLEFDWSIGRALALVLFLIFWIINKKCMVDRPSRTYPSEIHIYWHILNTKDYFYQLYHYFYQLPLWKINMICIMGTIIQIIFIFHFALYLFCVWATPLQRSCVAQTQPRDIQYLLINSKQTFSGINSIPKGCKINITFHQAIVNK